MDGVCYAEGIAYQGHLPFFSLKHLNEYFTSVFFAATVGFTYGLYRGTLSNLIALELPTAISAKLRSLQTLA